MTGADIFDAFVDKHGIKCRACIRALNQQEARDGSWFAQLALAADQNPGEDIALFPMDRISVVRREPGKTTDGARLLALPESTDRKDD